jgi:FkbM family methyltransferase
MDMINRAYRAYRKNGFKYIVNCGIQEVRQQNFRTICWKIRGLFSKTVTISTKQGKFTVLLGDKAIGKMLYVNRQFESDLMSKSMEFFRTIKKCPPKGRGTIIDIGANMGITSIGMLFTGEMEKAVAIEPEPKNLSILRHNVSQNGLEDKILVLPYAVSDQEKDLEFELSDVNFADHRVRMGQRDEGNANLKYNESNRDVIIVKGCKLDTLIDGLPDQFKDIAMVWVDVEGHEGYVFRGGRKFLSTGIPVVSEIWPYAIERSGMSLDEFCNIAKSIWTGYWIIQNDTFVCYPIEDLYSFVINISAYENVIFT